MQTRHTGARDGVFGALAEATDEVGRWIEDAQARLGRAIEPSLRIGVTGLARSGKTVFLTSLAANLLRRGRMPELRAEAEGRIRAAMLTPQPEMDAPRFDFERHLDALYADPPRWPQSTRSIGRLRVSVRYQPAGALARMIGETTLHLDFVDYPGEWLLDLALLPQSYAEWSRAALERAAARPEAAAFRAWLSEIDVAAPLDEARAQAGAEAYAAYLRAARGAGLSGLTPGRFLLPGELEGAPALTFAPTPPLEGAAAGAAPRDAVGREFARRFEAYKRVVVKPFFRDHFAKLDRQIVLVDALSAIAGGPEASADMATALREILAPFRPGAAPWLASVLGPALGGRRIDRVLVAVTKADHAHHTAHPALQSFAKSLLAETIDRAAFKGAEVDALALAALRATTETEIRQGGTTLPAVRGRLAETGAEALLYAGEPPESLRALARGDWSAEDFQAPAFAPPRLEPREDEGPPHIRLDRALEFLAGDRLA